MDLLTIKLVIIGDSGCGKTSLRGQYISGRFSTGYRATIGADFITKTLPNPLDPEAGAGIVLQIWDTAGQERFSSLSSAFFRGADAVILMYDVSSPNSLKSLTKWWNEFRERAPVHEGEEEDFCCIVVGNKVDIGVNGSGEANSNGTRAKGRWKVSEEEAVSFLETLIPRSSSPAISDDSEADYQHQQPDPIPSTNDQQEGPSSPPRRLSQAVSIVITDNTHRHHPPAPAAFSSSRSRSSTRIGYSVGTKNSLSSLATRESMYHTPASSFYESARSSPVPFPRDGSTPSPPQDKLGSVGRGRGSRYFNSGTHARRRSVSPGSVSSSSAVTITQSLFLRSNASALQTEPVPEPDSHRLDPPEQRPKLFFTSAKTGEGVADVFEYVARRVVGRWEWERRAREEEGAEAWDREGWQGNGDTITVGLRRPDTREGWGMRAAKGCCTS